MEKTNIQKVTLNFLFEKIKLIFSNKNEIIEKKITKRSTRKYHFSRKELEDFATSALSDENISIPDASYPYKKGGKPFSPITKIYYEDKYGQEMDFTSGEMVIKPSNQLKDK